MPADRHDIALNSKYQGAKRTEAGVVLTAHTPSHLITVRGSISAEGPLFLYGQTKFEAEVQRKHLE